MRGLEKRARGWVCRHPRLSDTDGATKVGRPRAPTRHPRPISSWQAFFLGTLDRSEVLDAGSSLGVLTCFDQVRNRDGGQHADDRDHDHDFDQSKTASRIDFHILSKALLHKLGQARPLRLLMGPLSHQGVELANTLFPNEQGDPERSSAMEGQTAGEIESCGLNRSVSGAIGSEHSRARNAEEGPAVQAARRQLVFVLVSVFQALLASASARFMARRQRQVSIKRTTRVEEEIQAPS